MTHRGMKSTIIIALLCVLPLAVWAQRTPQQPEREVLERWAAQRVQEALQKVPPNALSSTDAVRTEDTAAQIHAAVTGGVFGKDTVDKQRPHRPIRVGEFWVVSGSLPPNTAGGTAVSVIRASTGEVLRVFHEQ